MFGDKLFMLKNGIQFRHDIQTKLVSSTQRDTFQARLQNCGKRVLASSCLSIRKEQLGSHWTDFHEI